MRKESQTIVTFNKNFIFFFILLLFGPGLRAGSLDSITVDQNGNGDFTSIQAAIASIRAFRGDNAVKIFVKKGIYNEKVVIPAHLENIQLIGEDVMTTKIVYNDYSGKTVNCPDETGRTVLGTFGSYTLMVRGDKILIQNISIENSAGPIGQAIALHIEGDRIAFVNCRLLGFQDTLYLGKGRSFFSQCSINGSTDFIFGPGTAFFEKCKLVSLRNSYITAASTTVEQVYGFVFNQCDFIGMDSTINQVFLGRPWRPYAKTVLVDCYLGSHITAEGWNEWKGDKLFPEKEKTVFYAELGSKGPGAIDLTKRVVWSRQLRLNKRREYSLAKVLGDWDIHKMIDRAR